MFGGDSLQKMIDQKMVSDPKKIMDDIIKIWEKLK